MKQETIIRAMKALNTLAAQSLPIKAACAIHRMRTQLRPAWDFQREEEEKLIARLQPAIDQAGTLTFATPEDAQIFRDKIAEMNEMDAEGNTLPEGVPIHAVVLPVSALNGIQITANDVAALEGFVSFTED